MKSAASGNSFQGGVNYALLAYISWGLLPIYWKLLKEIPSFEILCHRIFWSFVFYTLLRAYKEKKWNFRTRLKNKELAYIALASFFVTGNWLLYIYSVNAGRIVESSLGYFINPLFNILLGVFFLNETLKYYHKVAIALVCVGVGLITLEAHAIPWVAFILASTFSFYGFIRKKIPVDSLAGGQFETLIFVPFTLIYFVIFRDQLSKHTIGQWALLIGSGVITALPLYWFSEAVKRIPYYLMGFFQFLAPSLMFLTGVLFYGENMSPLKFSGFLFIWSAMLWLLFKSLRKEKGALR